MNKQIPPKQAGRPAQHHKLFLALKVNQCTKPLPESIQGSAYYWAGKLKRTFTCRNVAPGMVRVWRAA